jgi:hypothetical protein
VNKVKDMNTHRLYEKQNALIKKSDKEEFNLKLSMVKYNEE